MSAPWLTLIGIGEDGREGLAGAARAALDAACVVIGGKRHLALAAPLHAETMCWPSPIEIIVPRLLTYRGTPVAVLATGDPFHYGVGTMLSQHIAAAEVRSFPQPSAFSLAASRICWTVQDCVLVSLHGRDDENFHRQIAPRTKILVLSWDGTTPAKIANMLRARGFGASRIIVLEAMGGARERIREATASNFDLVDIDPLNTIAVECAEENETLHASEMINGARTCLPDEAFAHDGQITKQGIRAVTLAALAPHDDELLWDIGAGSGSIAIEWLRAAPDARAIAIEARADRAARIASNAQRLGVSPHIVQGEAPAALTGLATPDAVFIGGGVSSSVLVEAAAAAVKPGGRIVANAVTLEAQANLMRAYETRGGALHLLQHAQAVAVGRFSGWKPAMPIVQWRWTKAV